jgi:glycosyltransferase involved in cell wall biosynthesis
MGAGDIGTLVGETQLDSTGVSRMVRAGAQAPLVSVIILTYNEEANLPACLGSLGGLRAEALVVDSGSTDGTVEIAQALGVAVYRHPFEHYAAQRNWAQRSLPLQCDWVLHLDADERLTSELVVEINSALEHVPAEVAGFLLRKRTMFMGRWMRHGGHYPSYHLRLFRKDCGECEERLYDQHYLVNGKVRELSHDYIDVLTSDLSAWSARHVRWAELEAREILNGHGGQGRVRAEAFGNPLERKRWLREGLYGRCPPFLRALLYWSYRYFLRFGFLDGKEGLIFHFLQGFWFRFLVDAKMFEIRRGQRNEHTLTEPPR